MTDASFLNRLMAQTGFSEEDAGHLARLLPAAEPRSQWLANRFYERILEDEEASATLGGNEARAERLKVTMVRWILSGLSGPHDAAWLEARARIGRVHVQVNLPQHLMVTAMNGLRRDLREILEDALADRSDERRATSRALDRLLDLELAIMLDTYREDSESRLARHERLATIGELAASIAHDLRNPLGVIQSSLFLLQRKVGEHPDSGRHLEKIHRQVERCNRIITDLLELVRGRDPKVAEVPLEPFLRGIATQAGVPEQIEVSVEVEEGAVLICDEGLVTQALCNLVQNASQAIGKEAGHLGLSAHPHPAGCELRVRDDGPGFPEELLTKAFEPLVTGRSTGVGLGLAIARGIAERHGGSAAASNNEGSAGATVCLFLPREPTLPEGIDAMKKGARVLIVDDNQDLAENLAEILGDLGYHPEVAHDGSAALALLGRERFSLVITDLKMPGLDGIQVLERVRVHWPELPVILMTAYAQEDLLSRASGGENGADAIFAKPLDLDLLLDSVSKICPPGRPLLLVEDDDDLRETLGESLEKTCPVEIVRCASGAGARAACDGRAFSVAILDLKLPDEDGLDLGAWLQAQHGEGVITLIYITGHRGDFETALEGVLASPGVHLLEKPFPPEKLLSLMDGIL